MSRPQAAFYAAAAPLTGTLELKASKENAHSSWIRSVGFSPDGKTIVSGSDDRMIKVWDAATPRPFNASEWEEVDISAMPKNRDGDVKIDGLGYIKSNYWKNKVTGDLRREYWDSTAGAPPRPSHHQPPGRRYASR